MPFESFQKLVLRLRGQGRTTLLEEVLARSNLWCAWRRVRRGGARPGIDHVTVQAFEENLHRNLEGLSREVRSGRYRPLPALRFYRLKPGGHERRPLCVMALRDRLVQRAVLQVLAPRMEEVLSPSSYGFRPGLGVADVMRRFQQLYLQGYRWVGRADIDSYFDSIDRTRLFRQLQEWLPDASVVELVRRSLEAGVVESGVHHVPSLGVPQGSILSPLMSNLYLIRFDRELARGGAEMIRYVDDLAFVGRTRSAVSRHLGKAHRLLGELGLRLNGAPQEGIVRFESGFVFLGHRIVRDEALPIKPGKGGKSGELGGCGRAGDLARPRAGGRTLHRRLGQAGPSA